MFKQRTWVMKRRSALYAGSSELKSTTKKVKGSLFAVLFGLIAACFVILASHNSPLQYFQILLLFVFSSKGQNQWDQTLIWWSVYVIAALALVVSFRTGMFNIGVSGQMLAAGAVVIAIGIKHDLSQPAAIIVAFLAGTLAAMAVALVTVTLKILFNIHEVVTSILLNWIVWFLVKWFFVTDKKLYNPDHASSSDMHSSMSLMVHNLEFIIPIILAIVLAFVVWIMLKKTTLGYKLKAVGLNPFASDYAGINRKRYAITSFAISGALAGIMGVIYYLTLNRSISFGSDTLPTMGFDSIATALVGQLNPWGVVAAGFLWGVIKSGGTIGTALNPPLPTATSDIIFGVIIYAAACAILLSKLEPVKFVIWYVNVWISKLRRQKANNYLANIFRNIGARFKNNMVHSKNHRELAKDYRTYLKQMREDSKNGQASSKELKIKFINAENLLVKNKLDRKEKNSILWAKIQQDWKAMRYYIGIEYSKIWSKGKIGEYNRRTSQKKQLYGEMLNEYIADHINYETEMHQAHLVLKEQLKNNAGNSADLKNNYKKTLINLKQDINQKFEILLKKERESLLIIKTNQGRETMNA